MVLKKSFYLLIFIIISIKICQSIKQSLVLKYKIYFPPIDDKSTKEQIYESIERNYIYTEFEIGNPPRKIPIFYHFNDSSLSFSSNLNFINTLDSTYSPSTSKSFKNLENGQSEEGLLFTIDDNSIIKNFTFLYPNLKEDNKNYYGLIGLQDFYLENSRKNVSKPNFLYQLKDLGIISYISFSINETSEEGGFININLEPNEYCPRLYSIQNKFITFVNGIENPDINTDLGEYLWNLDVSLVHYRNFEKKMITVNVDYYEMSKDIYVALLNPTYGLIKGPISFRKLMKADFFDEFIKKDICSLSKVNKLYFYSCDAKYKDILKKKFPVMNFYLLELEYTFVLDFDDLFYEKNGILFFLICHDSANNEQNKYSQISEWVLGRPFFKKYQFSFDVEKKLVTFYKKNPRFPYGHEINEGEKTDDKSKKGKKKSGNKDFYLDRLLPIKNLIFISLSIFTIFVAFFCIFYNLRVSHKKFEEEKELESLDEKGRKYSELSENLNNKN